MLPITIGSVLSKVSRQAVVVLLSRGASVLLAIASTILLSRLLGTAGLGQFRLGSVVVQLLTTFCLLGLDGGLLRYLPVLETHGGNGSRTLLARSSRVVIAISLALSVALLLGAPALATYYFHSPGMTNVLRVFSLQVPVLVLFRFLSSAVTAAKRVDFASRITNILSPAIFLALLALIGFVHPGLYGTVAARILAPLAEDFFKTVTKLLCYSGLIIFACIAIFRVELLHVFGKGFTAGATALLILAAGHLANVVTGPTGILLTMTGKQKWELANTISMVAFNFLLNLVLFPTMGLIGA